MQEFDPRRPPMRHAPRLLACAAGCAALGLGWRFTVPADHAQAATPRARPAYARSEAQIDVVGPEKVAVRVLPGETFEDAVRRAGVGPQDARRAASALGPAFDPAGVKAGMMLEAAVATPRDGRGPARLVALSMRTGPDSALTLSRTFDGALRLREMQETIRDEETVAQGAISESLFASAIRAGATPELTARVVRLFAHRLDLSRDVHAGDPFRIVFDRKVSDRGAVEAEELLYAEVGAKGQVTRVYRFRPPGAAGADDFDEFGQAVRGFLLRTPVGGARVTSGFGMRLHPILGYTRMHQGVDFGVPVGAPVLAAGDGVVEEARMVSGYGRWLKIRHAGGWETGYGHLSAWTVRPGQSVRQGQVVAYSGNSGSSTGPHLHYEVMQDGRTLDPKGAKVPQGKALTGRELAAFDAEKARVRSLLAAAAPSVAAPAAMALRDDAAIGLRRSLL